MEEELLNQQLVSSSTVQQKAVPKVDCDTCFSSFRFPESWRPSKWSFGFPESWHYSKWSFKNKKQKIGALSLEVLPESNKFESMAGDPVENDKNDDSFTDKELTDVTIINRQSSATPIDSWETMVYHSSLPKIESSSDASVDTIVERSIIRMLFVEDDPTIRNFAKLAVEKYNADLSKKYKIHYEFLTHGFLAVEHLMSSENIKPHIIVTDNNMESFYLSDDQACPDRKAGCELGKLLRPHKVHPDETSSIYRYVRVSETINSRPYNVKQRDEESVYEHIDYVCTYSDQLLDSIIEPFEGLVFLSTSDSAAELGPKNVALFDGLPPKLRYVQILSNFIDENETEIDKVICQYMAMYCSHCEPL